MEFDILIFCIGFTLGIVIRSLLNKIVQQPQGALYISEYEDGSHDIALAINTDIESLARHDQVTLDIFTQEKTDLL